MQIAGLGTRAYPYVQTVAPTSGAVTKDTLKAHLRLTTCSQDEVLQLYLDAAIEFAEECTGLALINRTFETFRDFFPILMNEGYYPAGFIPETFNQFEGNTGFELRRTPVDSVVSVEFAPLTAPTTFETITNTNYYVTDAEAGKFAKVLAQPEFQWPTDLVVPRVGSIKITFVAGFGNAPKNIPADIRTAILEHAANLFSNRGDCANCGDGLPTAAKVIYSKRKVVNL